MKPSIEKLDAGLKEIIETQGRSSKAKIIKDLFPRICEAMSEGITLDMLVDFLGQNEVAVTKNTLRNTLYRIRKERNESNELPKQSSNSTQIQSSSLPESEITPPTNQTSSTDEEVNEYDQMMEKYSLLKNQVDKYVLLGGKREDIENKPISTQRSMVSNLRTQLRHKHKGIY